MAKKPASKRKLSLRVSRRHLRYWPAFAIGVVFAALGVFLWVSSSRALFDSQLLQKLPKDSYLAGAARISQFTPDTLNQVSQSAKLDPVRSTALVQTLQAAGLDQAKLKDALDDQFSFARTNRGDLAIFTVKQEAGFADAANRLAGKAPDAKTTKLQTNSGTLTVWQGTPAAGQPAVTVYRSGRTVYVATNPDLVVAAAREGDGFASLDQFPAVSKRLPAGADAYLFFNVSQLKDPPVAFPLTGVAVTDQKDQLKLAVRVADPAVVSGSLPNTDGTLLPGTDSASAAVEGTDAASYLHLLEEQRQSSDLPRVIALQNGIASLNRTLGVDLEHDFLGQADGPFVYARYQAGDGSGQWFGALKFGSAQAATDKVNQLTALLRDKVTVPTRHERVRTLPDGTQSREIVSEGNEALSITDVQVEGHNGSTAQFPGMGNVVWVVDGDYLVLGSSSDAAARMVRTIAHPSAKLDERGELAVRAKLSEVPGLLGSRDGLFNWILATQPESGSFTLSKSTGVLQGTARFKQAGR